MANNDRNPYLIPGIVLLVSGIIFNPWLIAALLGSTFSTTVKAGFVTTELVLLITGYGLITRRREFLGWIGDKYRDLAVIVLNILILFFAINIIASLLIKKPESVKPDQSYFYSPNDLFVDSIAFMRAVYPGKSDADIQELLLLQSPYANHPVLEYQERIQSSRHYNTGFEGIRFDDRVNRSNAASLINGAVWVFGGSTTFGQGVSDNETIPAYLNHLDPSRTYINFGVHAYHQSNEIDKLLLLLRKGYTPSHVVFIDGLNDLIRMTETNFHPLETPALAKSAYTSDYNIATKAASTSFLRQLPVTRWLRSLIDEGDDETIEATLPWNAYDIVYDAENLYNTDPKAHYMATIRRSPYNVVDSAGLSYIAWKMKVMYDANYRFLEHLAGSYNFSFDIFFQPQGVLSASNPFWRNKNKAQETPLYKNFSSVIPNVKSYMVQQHLPQFTDISELNSDCPDCYVDLTHYNPAMNEIIAKAILLKINNGLSNPK